MTSRPFWSWKSAVGVIIFIEYFMISGGILGPPPDTIQFVIFSFRIESNIVTQSSFPWMLGATELPPCMQNSAWGCKTAEDGPACVGPSRGLPTEAGVGEQSPGRIPSMPGRITAGLTAGKLTRFLVNLEEDDCP